MRILNLDKVIEFDEETKNYYIAGYENRIAAEIPFDISIIREQKIDFDILGVPVISYADNNLQTALYDIIDQQLLELDWDDMEYEKIETYLIINTESEEIPIGLMIVIYPVCQNEIETSQLKETMFLDIETEINEKLELTCYVLQQVI